MKIPQICKTYGNYLFGKSITVKVKLRATDLQSSSTTYTCTSPRGCVTFLKNKKKNKIKKCNHR